MGGTRATRGMSAPACARPTKLSLYPSVQHPYNMTSHHLCALGSMVPCSIPPHWPSSPRPSTRTDDVHACVDGAVATAGGGVLQGRSKRGQGPGKPLQAQAVHGKGQPAAWHAQRGVGQQRQRLHPGRPPHILQREHGGVVVAAKLAGRGPLGRIAGGSRAGGCGRKLNGAQWALRCTVCRAPALDGW